MKKKYIIDNIEFNSDLEMEKFKEVFNFIGSFILNYNDRELEGIVYEEYDDRQCSTLIDFKLDILLDSGYITHDIKTKAQEIQTLNEKVLNDKVERSASFIRNSLEWKRIIFLADEIREFLSKQLLN